MGRHRNWERDIVKKIYDLDFFLCLWCLNITHFNPNSWTNLIWLTIGTIYAAKGIKNFYNND